MKLALVLVDGARLVSLSVLHVIILAFYYGPIALIGSYLQRKTKSGEEFSLAGRGMTAWIAALGFLSAKLTVFELMGRGAVSYQYGILAVHRHWIGGILAMLFLGLRMMPPFSRRGGGVPGFRVLNILFW
jgi:SSS family solute:Na+ symporter